MHEQDLIQLLKLHNNKAQFEVYNRYNNRLKRFLNTKVTELDEEQVQEIVHNAFLKAFIKIDLYSGKGTFVAWLVEITYRCYLQWRKEMHLWMYKGKMVYKPRTRFYSTATETVREINFLKEVEYSNFLIPNIDQCIDVQRIMDYIRLIPTKEKKVVHLLIQGYTKQEIHKKTNMSLSHINVLQKRIQTKLKKIYE